MKKKGYHGVHNRSGKSYGNNPFAKKKYFECGEIGHISTNYKKMKKILARARSLKARKIYSRSITRRKMARLAMLNEIRMQFQIPVLMMMMMLNPPRKVLSILTSRILHIFSTHLIALWQKLNQRYVMMMNSLMMILLRW
jgi:hypothetical protein